MSVRSTSAGGAASAPCDASDLTGRWYLVQTDAGCEILADSHLTRAGYRTYLPSTLRTLRHARQQRMTETPFFPGCLFVALDLEAQPWQQIERAPGVRRLLTVGSQPAPAPVGFVEALMEVGDLDANSGPPHLPEAVGQSGSGAVDIAQRLAALRALSGADRVGALLAALMPPPGAATGGEPGELAGATS